MGDPNDSLAHTLKGLKLKFSDKDPSDVRDWRKEISLILSIYRKDLVSITKGNHRPAEGTTSTTSTTDESTTAPHALEQAQATYDKASQDLCTILYLLTESLHKSWYSSTKTRRESGATARRPGRSWNQSF